MKNDAIPDKQSKDPAAAGFFFATEFLIIKDRINRIFYRQDYRINRIIFNNCIVGQFHDSRISTTRHSLNLEH